jgi:hypothetical protein
MWYIDFKVSIHDVFIMKKIILSLFIGIFIGASSTFAASQLFLDVPEGVWFSSAVNNLSEKGILQGYQNGTFGPANTVNRAELAVTLDRMMEYMETGKVSVVDSGWETSEHGLYQISYPKGWSWGIDGGQVDVTSPTRIQEINNSMPVRQFNVSVYVFGGNYAYARPFEDVGRENLGLEEWISTAADDFGFLDRTEVVVDGVKGYRGVGAAFGDHIWMFEKDGVIYTITVDNAQDDLEDSIKIVESFRFNQK